MLGVGKTKNQIEEQWQRLPQFHKLKGWAHAFELLLWHILGISFRIIISVSGSNGRMADQVPRSFVGRNE
jgi:hypothetical protein